MPVSLNDDVLGKENQNKQKPMTEDTALSYSCFFYFRLRSTAALRNIWAP